MLLLQLAAAADTLIVRQVPPVRSGFEQAVFVLSGVTSVVALALMAVTVWVLLALRQRALETRARMDALMLELRPLVEKAGTALDETRALARHASGIIERSQDTIAFADEKVRKSVTVLTDRVDDVSTLIGRVHASAERVESVASTTVAGIKLGARALGLSRRKKKRKASQAARPPRPRLRRTD